MKCLEVFYSLKDAERFVRVFCDYEGADPEIIDTYESDDNGIEYACWAVYYNPRKTR